MKVSFGKRCLLLLISVVCLICIAICGFSLLNENKTCKETEIVCESEENSIKPSEPISVGVGDEHEVVILGSKASGSMFDYVVNWASAGYDSSFLENHDIVSISIVDSGNVPPVETATYVDRGGGHGNYKEYLPSTPKYADYFSYEYKDEVASGLNCVTYTRKFTYKKPLANVAPTSINYSQGKVTIRSYSTIPSVEITYKIKTSTLTINGPTGKPLATITGLYGNTVMVPTTDTVSQISSYGATYVSFTAAYYTIDGSRKTVVSPDGKYISKWNYSLGKGATVKSGYYTFGSGDSSFSPTLETIKVAVVFKDCDGNEKSHQTINYGGKVSKPADTSIISAKEAQGYELTWYREDTYTIFNFNSAVEPENGAVVLYLKAYKEAKRFTITWLANEGYFYEATDNQTDYVRTNTYFDSEYVFPDVEPTRLGYEFTGWKSTLNNKTIEAGAYLENVNNTTFKATWQIKKDLTVTFTEDNNIRTYSVDVTLDGSNIRHYTYQKGQSDINYSYSSVLGKTVFTLSNIYCVTNWEFDKLEFTKVENKTEVSAIEGKDYILTTEDDKHYIEIGTSLTIKLTSCITFTLIALSNFDNESEFVEDTNGGSIAIGDAYSKFNEEEVKQKETVSYNGSVEINANLNTAKEAVFKGFYSSNQYDTLKKQVKGEPFSTSTKYEYKNITACIVVYAVFYFEFFDVTVYTYSDDYNFEGKTTDISPDSNAGYATLTTKYNDNSLTDSGSTAHIRMPQGESCVIQINLNNFNFEYARYEFVGYYTSLLSLIDNKSNKPDDAYSGSNLNIYVKENNTLYAKIVKKYALVITASNDGISELSIGSEKEKKEIIKYYSYKEKITDQISCKVAQVGYEESNVIWKVDENDSSLSNEIKKIINACTKLTLPELSSFVMKDSVIKISVQGIPKKYTLTVSALYGNLDADLYVSNLGGTGDIIDSSSEHDEVIFGNDNGIMGSKSTVTATVQYGCSTVQLQANAKKGYIFTGWYSSTQYVNYLLKGDPLKSKNGLYNLPSMEGDTTFYCVFVPCYTFTLTVDERISSVDITGNEVYPTQKDDSSPSASPFIVESYSSNVITFKLELSKGHVDNIQQLQTNSAITLTCNETLTEVSFVMPSWNVELKVITAKDNEYALKVASYYVEDMQGFSYNDAGFDNNCGKVLLKTMNQYSNVIEVNVEENTPQTFIAKAGSGFAFLGWYKFRAGEVSGSDFIVSKKVSYGTKMTDWFDIYDEITNPNAAYVSLGSEQEITIESVARNNSNLYIAVFVKTHTITFVSGDRGIKNTTVSYSSMYDDDNDGYLDDANTISNDKTTKTLSLASGYIIDLSIEVNKNFSFTKYKITQGQDLLADGPNSYKVQDMEILEKDLISPYYALNFYLYKDIEIIAYTASEERNLTVNIYTYDIDGQPVSSLEGGTFDKATIAQDYVCALVIGASLSGYLTVNPGFVFAKFEGYNDDGDVITLSNDYVMPEKNITVNVYFARNSYILNLYTYYKGEDGSPRKDTNNVGGVVSCQHSILFGGANVISLTASAGYVLEGIYTTKKLNTLVDNYNEQGNIVETLENYIYSYTYTTPILTEVPATPDTPAFNLYVVFELKLFNITTEETCTELNSGEKKSILDAKGNGLLNISNNKKAYYGQIVTITTSGNQNLRYYKAYKIQVINMDTNSTITLKGNESALEGFSCIVNSKTWYFTTPVAIKGIKIIFELEYYEMSIKFDAQTNNGTFDNSYVNPNSSGDVDATVYYNYNNYACQNAIKKSVQSKNIPYATKIGFKLIGYNTKADGTGLWLVTYYYGNNAYKENALPSRIDIKDFVLDENFDKYSETQTLYAIFDYADIIENVNYTNGENVKVYNGELQSILQVSVENFNNEIPYIFTCYKVEAEGDVLVGTYYFESTTTQNENAGYLFNKDNEVITDFNNSYINKRIKLTEGDSISSATFELFLRSVNQSGTYKCEVAIDGGALFDFDSERKSRKNNIKTSINTVVTIDNINLLIYLDSTTTYIGTQTFILDHRNVEGLLNFHTVDNTNSYLTLEENPNDDITYKNDNILSSFYELNIKNTELNCLQQDEYEISSNYNVQFVNSCTIKHYTNEIKVQSAVYLRKIKQDGSNYTDEYETLPTSTMNVYEMRYEYFGQDIGDNTASMSSGYFINYLKPNADYFNKTLSIWFDIVSGYEFYEIWINNVQLTSDKYEVTKSTNTVSFTFTEDMYALDSNSHNLCDIRIYVTNECIVTAHYNVTGVADYQFVATYNQVFNGPSKIVEREYFELVGWFYDKYFAYQIPDVWQKVGKQDIYAQWSLGDIKDSMSIIVKDNGVTQTVENNEYQKTYDAHAISLSYTSLDISEIYIDTAWYKYQYGMWRTVQNSVVKNLLNVDNDSGLYSLEVKFYESATDLLVYTLSRGILFIDISITPYTLDIPEGTFDKVYDAKTSVTKTIAGLTGQLQVVGEFESKDVCYLENVVVNQNIVNAKLNKIGSELASNYSLPETLQGKITPLDVSLECNASKTYDGNIFSRNFEQKLLGGLEVVNYRIETNDVIAKTYLCDDINAPIINSVSSSKGNFNFSLASTAQVVINKATFDGLFVFKNVFVEYDGEYHTITAKYQEKDISTSTDGVKAVEYVDASTNLPIVDGFINVGKYTINVNVTGDDNHEDWSSTAILTINKIQFTVTYLYNNGSVPETIYYNEEDIKNNFSFNSNPSELPATFNGMILVNGININETSIKDVGNYELSLEYDTDNYQLIGVTTCAFSIVVQQISIGDFFNENLVVELTYSGLDQKDDVLEKTLLNESDVYTLCDFSSPLIKQKNLITGFLFTCESIINAGEYEVIYSLSLKDPNKYKFENNINTVTVTVAVSKYNITSFSDIIISKIYDGTKDTSGVVYVDLSNGNPPEELTLTGKYADSNVGSNIPLTTFEIDCGQNFTYDENNFNFYGEITQKDITVNVDYTTYNADFISTGEYILTISKSLRQEFVEGMVNGEYLNLSICCSTSEPRTDDITFNVGDSSRVTIDTANATVEGGEYSNYNLVSISGSITLLAEQYIIVEVVENGNGFDNIYSGSAKDLYLNINDILCKYNVIDNIFEPIHSGESVYEVKIASYSQCVDVNDYYLSLYTGLEYVKFSTTGENSMTVTYTITPYIIYQQTEITVEYNESVNDVSNSTIGVNAETIIYSVDLKDVDTTQCGDQLLTINSEDNADMFAYDDDTSTGDFNNYYINLEVTVHVIPKKLSVQSQVFDDQVYSASDIKASCDNWYYAAISFEDANGNYTNIAKDSDWIIIYFVDDKQVYNIENVGTYTAKIKCISGNYLFKDENSNYVDTLALDSFEITKANIDVEFIFANNTTSFEYNGQYQNPVSVKFTFNNVEIIDITSTLSVKDSNNNIYPNGAKNVGQYTVGVTIQSDNFKIDEDNIPTTTFSITPATFNPTPPIENETWFSKYVGEEDPPIMKDFITQFGDSVNVSFTRDTSGENSEKVGRYSLTANDDIFNENYPNYVLGTFNDANGGFEILSLIGTGATVTVDMIENIVVSYSGEYVSTITLSDHYDAFNLLDKNNNPIDLVKYDIEIIFAIQGGPVKNVGTYNFTIESVITTTHDPSLFTFNSNGKNFIIEKSVLSIDFGSYIPIKQYDGTYDAIFDSSQYSFTGLSDNDKSYVILQGVYENINASENLQNITLTLGGDLFSNYELQTESVQGFITKRILTLSGNFDKIYDASNVVNMAYIYIDNSCGNDDVGLTGKYSTGKVVGDDIPIIFAVENSNYSVDDTSYKGSIYQKELTLSNPTITKPYDGTSSADLTGNSLVGVCSGDIVALDTGTFLDTASLTADASVNDKYVEITLCGEDANNYYINNVYGSITVREFNAKFFYGDEDEYAVNFVEDGLSIIKDRTDAYVDYQPVKYGYTFNYIKNYYTQFPAPTRKGYTLLGWSLEKNDATKIIDVGYDTSKFDIDEIIANDNSLKLYAIWEINQYTIDFTLMTENVEDDDYFISGLGGEFKFDDDDISQKWQISVDYYTDHTINVCPNDNFTAYSFEINNTSLALDVEYQFIAEEDLVVVAKFVRNNITFTINCPDAEDVEGFDGDWIKTNQTFVNKQKYGSSINLPYLSAYGYDFTGYSDDFVINQNIIMLENKSITANFDAKTVNICVKTYGGVGDENFEYVDSQEKTINVIYNTKFGALPNLTKQGYQFGGYILVLNEEELQEINENTVLKYIEENLQLHAIWNKIENRFILATELDKSYYEEKNLNDYQEFESGLALYYAANSEKQHQLYTSEFTSLTETVVSVQYVNFEPELYQFDYWKVGDEKLDVSKTLDGVSYTLQNDGITLVVSGFLWGENAQTLTAVYKPCEYDVTINEYQTNYGNITLESGTYTVGELNKTLTGTIIAVSYEEYPGYYLDENNVTVTGASAVNTNNKFALSDIKQDVQIDMQFLKNKFGFGVDISGYSEAVAYVKYSINNFDNLIDYSSEAQLQTGDKLCMSIGIYHGYKITSFTTTSTLSMAWNGTTTDDSVMAYTYSVSGFTSQFNVSVVTGLEEYNLEVDQLVFDGQNYQNVSVNYADILDEDSDESIDKIEYLKTVNFVAKNIPIEKIVEGNTINVDVYDFIGWYVKCDNDDMLLISKSETYNVTIYNNIKYYAVFQLVDFSVYFDVDDDCGQLVNDDNNVVSKIEVVTAGENLKTSYHVQTNAGYKFIGWKITYNYTDNESTSTTQTTEQTTISMLGNGGIYSDVICKALFEKVAVTINVIAKMEDGSELNAGNYVVCGDESGSSISVSKTTNDQFSVKAVSGLGYKFLRWDFNELSSNYLIGRNTTTIMTNSVLTEDHGEYYYLDKAVGTTNAFDMTIFNGEITEYNITAVFDYADVNIDLAFEVADTVPITTFAYTIIDKDNGIDFPVLVNTSETVVGYIYIYKGFFLTKDEIKYYVEDENVVVGIENITTSLLNAERETYSEKYKITISNFITDTKVVIYGDSTTTTLNFAQLVDYDEQIYEENVFTGYIKYCTNNICVENEQALHPEMENLVFYGWSTNKSTTGLLLDTNGDLIDPYWTSLDEQVSLYPVFKLNEVNVKFSISTTDGLVNKDTFIEDVMKNIAPDKYKTVDGNFYFKIGTTFGLNVPDIENKYHFYGYQYYIVEDGRINTKLIYIGMENELGEIENLASISLFEIKDYLRYEYSSASNFADFSNLEDGCFYIEYVLEMEIEFEVENFYADSDKAIGGTLTIIDHLNTKRGFYNQTLQIQANLEEGYEVKEWYVNSTLVDSSVDVLEYVLKKPTTFKVVFIGKLVTIAFGESANGIGKTILGADSYSESDNVYFARVGQNISLFAESNVGYKFENKWLHSNGQTLTSSTYKLTAQDGEAGNISLTPLFVVRDIEVWINVPEKLVHVYRLNKEMAYSQSENSWLYSYKMKYFDDVEFNFSIEQKYCFVSATLFAGLDEKDISNKVNNNVVKFDYSYYNDSANLTININIEKTYWQNLLIEQDLLVETESGMTLKNDFTGSGKSNDPYRIENYTDLVKLAYVINNNVAQTNLLNKNPYNSPTTYYEISYTINLQERFWTPIGIKENPFNSIISIYYMPQNIKITTDDPNIPSQSSLDSTVLDAYSGLFGALGDDAQINIKIKNFMLIYVIIGIIFFVVLLIIIVLVVIKKLRENKIKNFDEHNKYLFDKE